MRSFGPADATRVFVLVHAWLGTEHEMLDLGRRLGESGFGARCVRLLGHGTVKEDLANYGIDDWIRQIADTVEAEEARGARVVLLGQCGGANLALLYAATRRSKRPLAGLALGAVTSFISPREHTLAALAMARIHRYLLRPIEGLIGTHRLGRVSIRMPVPDDGVLPWFGYNDCFPIYSVGPIVDLVRRCERLLLRDLPFPVLVAHYENDPLYSAEHARRLFERLPSGGAHRLLLLPNDLDGPIDGHLIFNNPVTCDRIFSALTDLAADGATSPGETATHAPAASRCLEPLVEL